MAWEKLPQWSSLSSVSPPAGVVDARNILRVFVGGDSSIAEYQRAPDGRWSVWSPIAAPAPGTSSTGIAFGAQRVGVGASKPGFMSLFVTGQDDQVYVAGTPVDGSYSWSLWNAIPPAPPQKFLVGAPAVVTSNNLINVIVASAQPPSSGFNAGPFMTGETTVAGDYTAGWASMNSGWNRPASAAISSAVNHNSRIQLATADSSNSAVITLDVDSPTSTWQSVPGPASAPPAPGLTFVSDPALAADGVPEGGMLEVVVVGSDGNVYQISEGLFGAGFSGRNWNNLEAPAASLFLSGSPPLPARAVIGMEADDRLEVFVCGTDNKVYRKCQNEGGGAWTDGWHSLGGPGPALTPPVPLVVSYLGLIHVFVLGADGSLYCFAQSTPNQWPAGPAHISGTVVGGIHISKTGAGITP
jgi:hypothetical protein